MFEELQKMNIGLFSLYWLQRPNSNSLFRAPIHKGFALSIWFGHYKIHIISKYISSNNVGLCNRPSLSSEVENIFMTLEQFTKIIDHCTVHRHNRFARFDFKSKQTFRVQIPNILNSEKYQVLFSSLQEDSEDFKSSVAN